jgi:hypothetical protein
MRSVPREVVDRIGFVRISFDCRHGCTPKYRPGATLTAVNQAVQGSAWAKDRPHRCHNGHPGATEAILLAHRLPSRCDAGAVLQLQGVRQGDAEQRLRLAFGLDQSGRDERLPESVPPIKVLRIHRVNRTKEKLDSIGIQLSGKFSIGLGVHFKQVLRRDGGIGA